MESLFYFTKFFFEIAEDVGGIGAVFLILAGLSPFTTIIIWVVNFFISYSKTLFVKSFLGGFIFFVLSFLAFFLWVNAQNFQGFGGLGILIMGTTVLANLILLYSSVFLIYFLRNRGRKEDNTTDLNPSILDADVNFNE